MVKAIILDEGYKSKDVIVKFGKNYECISLKYFLNLLCGSHLSDYEVKTVHFEDIESDVVVSEWFITLSNMSLHASAIQSCEEFENLWESDEVVDGIDLY